MSANVLARLLEHDPATEFILYAHDGLPVEPLADLAERAKARHPSRSRARRGIDRRGARSNRAKIPIDSTGSFYLAPWIKPRDTTRRRNRSTT